MNKTTEDFIKEAKLLNPNYDYSQVVYNGNKDKIKIICDKGHIFYQSPNHHLKGEKCPYCSKCWKYTTETFIEKCKKIHSNKYDYSLVEYKNTRSKVKIICPVHGIFEQNAGSHLLGYGCSKCGRDVIRKSTQELVEQLKQLYGDYYNYSLVEWSGRENKIKIICPKHNIQEINTRYALRGNMCCKECYFDTRRLTQEQFLEQAKKIHGNSFDYSKSVYKNATTPIIIKCSKGHTFKMKPQMHLYNCCGCPICMSEKHSSGERKIRWYLAQNKIEFEEQKTFDGCKHKQLLLFDFYLPQYNLCIEYQGLQHYQITNWFGGVKEFELRQLRDNIKREFCKKNNIDLLEIKYNESVSKKLKEYFIKKGQKYYEKNK
jgi:hypothetical protein